MTHDRTTSDATHAFVCDILRIVTGLTVVMKTRKTIIRTIVLSAMMLDEIRYFAALSSPAITV